MKKFLFTAGSVLLIALGSHAQRNNIDKKEENFDKRYRFGIRATPQPTWFKSGNTSSKGDGALFGFGFGLCMEVKLSNIIHFATGIGGDFEGGYISYRNDANFNVRTVLDNEGNPVEAKNGMSRSDYDQKNGSTLYTLKSRKYKTTMVTIPLLLKMMTSEYSGFRYFAVFGGEIGIRAAVKADDEYYSGATTTIDASNHMSTTFAAELKKSNVMVGKDATFIPLRAGMNLGLGTEYRLGGSTSLVFSVNYFQAFTNLMRSESKYVTKDMVLDPTNNTYNFSALNQSYLMRAVRINVGIMF